MGERHSRSSDDGVFHSVSKLRRVGDVRGVRPGVFASEAKGESRTRPASEGSRAEDSARWPLASSLRIVGRRRSAIVVCFSLFFVVF